jgi:hypothetical protein
MTIPEIARSLRTRDHTVRSILVNSPRFQTRSGLSGRSPKARGWFLTSDSSPTRPAQRTSPPKTATAPRSPREALELEPRRHCNVQPRASQ